MAGGAPIGNDFARRGKMFRDVMDRCIKQDDGKRLRATMEKLFDLAASGEAWAVQMIADRLDGKAVQMVAGDPDGAPIQVIDMTPAQALRTLVRGAGEG